MINPHTANLISTSIFLAMVVGIPLYGQLRKVPVFEVFMDGAKEGFDVVLRILPALVGMLVAIGMLRASGFFASISHSLGSWLANIGMPIETLQLALIRPFSGGAANASLVEIIQQYGGDSFAAKVGATIMGSTETTFYVIAVYFSVVSINRTRHAIPTGLCADLVGVIASVWICHWLFT